MSHDAAPLDHLCARCGIETGYNDIWGNYRHAPESTKLRLLQAMGVDIHDAAGAAAALTGIEEREWQRALPPVTVVRDGVAPPRLVLCAPAALASDKISWLLEFENRERVSGELPLGALQPLAARDIAGVHYLQWTFDLPALPGHGYHSFSLLKAGSAAPIASTRLIVCPARCYQPDSLAGGGRTWGPAVQLYAVRSGRNWGMGDFGDLARLTDFATGAGAGIIGVNPLHALFPGKPGEASPYRPSNRSRFNVLYLDVEAIADFGECPAAGERVRAPDFQARLRALRDTDFVDYPGVARAKFEVLELLYRHFREQHVHRGSARAREFQEYQVAGGDALRLHAAFEALQERFSRENPAVWGWPAWPEAFRNPASKAVTTFVRDHGDRVEYFQYLQWQTELQLAATAGRARALGVPLGLYLDLAVGVNPGGAETWSNPGLHALEATVGCPPDDFNLKGQEWGLPPWNPRRLAEAGYAPYIATLRGCMRYAGALRIDHVMGLMRLFWIPAGSGPDEGTYVNYPFSDLLGILALESQRYRCLVIGEDLGTVPHAVRAAMVSLDMLSYRPLYFQRAHDGEFLAPESYPRNAVVTISTHDLPTLSGYWGSLDLSARTALGLFPSEEMRGQHIAGRAQDRARLLAALERAGLLPAGIHAGSCVPEELSDELVRALHVFLARTPSKILTVQLEDLLGQADQVNLPGTTDDRHPNWRRKLPSTLEAMATDARVAALGRILRAERD